MDMYLNAKNVLIKLTILVIPRVNNLYIEESFLLSNTPVKTHSVKLWSNITEFVRFFLHNQLRQQLNIISLKNHSDQCNSATSKFQLLGWL